MSSEWESRREEAQEERSHVRSEWEGGAPACRCVGPRPAHGKEAPAKMGQFNSLENTAQRVKWEERRRLVGRGERGRQSAAGLPCLSPGATSRGGQCVVSLSGHSSHTHNGTACCGARSVSGVLQSVPQMWPLCLGVAGTDALC